MATRENVKQGPGQNTVQALRHWWTSPICEWSVSVSRIWHQKASKWASNTHKTQSIKYLTASSKQKVRCIAGTLCFLGSLISHSVSHLIFRVFISVVCNAHRFCPLLLFSCALHCLFQDCLTTNRCKDKNTACLPTYGVRYHSPSFSRFIHCTSRRDEVHKKWFSRKEKKKKRN